MKVLLRNHGLNLMGVKTNLYTSIGVFIIGRSPSHVALIVDVRMFHDTGLDSKHASGISSTVCPPTIPSDHHPLTDMGMGAHHVARRSGRTQPS